MATITKLDEELNSAQVALAAAQAQALVDIIVARAEVAAVIAEAEEAFGTAWVEVKKTADDEFTTGFV